jgi:large subunit ribosomal protein L6
MVQGVSAGYAQSLDLYGVGYRAELKGKDLTLSLGLSHQVKYPLPASVNAKVEILDEGGTKRPRLHLDSCDKELLGQVAARIRSFRPPEPYKGKGVRYVGEKIKMKAGKAGKTGAKGK